MLVLDYLHALPTQPRTFTHPTLCLSFTESPLFVDRGLFITPVVLRLPPQGCVKEYELRLRQLIEYLDDSLLVPASHHVSGSERPKRAAFAVVTALASLFSTLAIGSGISNTVQISKLAETVSYITSNTETIVFELDRIKKTIIELQSAHFNSFLAIKQAVDVVQAQAEHNSCQIGLNRIDNIIQSLLSQQLTNHLLPPSQILGFLRSSPVLRDSLYTAHPRLIYKMGKTELVSVDPQRSTFTILVMLPHINRQPEGVLITSLFAPRFFKEGNTTFIEDAPHFPSLFSLSPPGSPRTTLMSMDESKCSHINKGAICPLSAQFFHPLTLCTNSLFYNDTDPDKHVELCGFKKVATPVDVITNFAENPSSLILFSNQVTVGVTPAGRINVIPPGAPPSCIALNKLTLSALNVGNRTILLNLRTDSFSLASPDAAVLRHVHSLKRPLPYGTRKSTVVSPFHPLSRHFASSLLVSILTSTLVVLIILGGFILLGIYMNRKRQAARNGLVHNPSRARQFLERATPETEEATP